MHDGLRADTQTGSAAFKGRDAPGHAAVALVSLARFGKPKVILNNMQSSASWCIGCKTHAALNE